MNTPPDRSCRTGEVHGYDVYIWECIDQQRVVVYAYSGETSCEEPQREVVACGQLTAIEQELGALVEDGCAPVPDVMRWR